jgi:microcystin-dependent protein
MASPPFNPNETVPVDSGVVSQYPSQERLFRDAVESWLLYEHGRSGHHAFFCQADSARDADSTWEIGSLNYSTTLGQLQFATSIGPVVWRGLDFETNTATFFAQTSAPTGWTKVTNSVYNDIAIRGVTGTSGGVVTAGTGFQTVFASLTPTGTVSATALSVAQLPAHRHLMFVDATGTSLANSSSDNITKAGSFSSVSDYSMAKSASDATIGLTSSIGSGATHTHTITISPITLNVGYIDVILALKN